MTSSTVVTEPEEVKGASITLLQTVLRGDDVLVDGHVQVAFVSGGRARPIPKPLRIAMRAEQDAHVASTRSLTENRLIAPMMRGALSTRRPASC